MPMYRYRCTSCKCEFDVQASVEDRNCPRNCPECEMIAVRLITAGNFVVKGFNANNGYSRR